MPLRLKPAGLILATALVTPGLHSGCSNEAKTPEAQEAQKAAGIQPEGGTEKTVKTVKDVVVERETRVVDPKTGQVLSDVKESTPVKVTEEKKEVRDVKVDVGDTKTTGAPAKK